MFYDDDDSNMYCDCGKDVSPDGEFELTYSV